MNEILIPPNSTLICVITNNVNKNKIIAYKEDDTFYLESWIGLDTGDFEKNIRHTKDEAKIKATIRAIKKQIAKDQTLIDTITIQEA